LQATHSVNMIVEQTVQGTADIARSSTDFAKRQLVSSQSVSNFNRPPKGAKGRSSILKAKDAKELAERIGLMRYPVGPQMKLYEKVWMTLDDPEFINEHGVGSSLPHLAAYYAAFSVFLIVFSCVALCLEDELNCVRKVEYIESTLTNSSRDYVGPLVTPENCVTWEKAWLYIEYATVGCFTLELAIRYATAPDRSRFRRMGFNWVDLLAVAPFYVEICVLAARNELDQRVSDPLPLNASWHEPVQRDSVLTALSVLRVLRLARVFKLLKMGNLSAMQLVSSTAGAALCDSFALLTSLMMVTIIAMIVFSAAVSQLEPGTDLTNWPSDKNSWFLSTPRTYWWSLVTLTGVGYGDEYPRKLPGRVLAIVCAIVGIIVVAVPIEVIGRYFGQHYKSHVYSREVAKECEVDGVLQFRPLYEKLVKLSSQGLLRVRCPRDEREVEAVVAAYDGKGNCRLESDEWSALIEDLVAHRGDWEGCALRRTVDYLAEARDGVRELHREVDELRKRRTKQHDELCALVRERFPHGVPKGGVRGARAKEAG